MTAFDLTPRRLARRRGTILSVLLATVLLATVLAAAPAFARNHYDRRNANGNQVILHAAPADAARLAARHGFEIAGEIEAEGVYAVLLEAPASLTAAQVMRLLAGEPGVLDVSPVELAALPPAQLIQPAQEDVAVDLAKQHDFTTPCLGQGFAGLLWSGYADQEAARQIRLHEGHLESGDCGTAAVVAVLDTGVDPDHELLEGGLVPGYDFLLETAGVPSELAALDQSVAAILEQSVAAILEQSVAAILEGEGELLVLEQSVAAILEQSVAAILEQQPLPAYYGHGTMVAGLVRLAAPTARVMPLRVFDGEGQGHLFDVVRAIYYAVDHGADVISMSFSMESGAKELKKAVRYARNRGVVCVAAAGNQGQPTMVYPAGFPDALGVAALAGEELASYSNYGFPLVDLGAPGNGVISAYPGGLYGAGWGTSFSAPLVAGTAALLVHHYPASNAASVQRIELALRDGSEPIGGLAGLIGSGRLDVLGTVREAP